MEEYRVVSVLPLGKKKYKIIMEGTKTIILSLYPSEVRRYSLSEGNTVSGELFLELRELLYKRGKERALYYLKTSDKTVSQMRTKLKEGFYPDEIVGEIIDFLKRYGYLDDFRYAQNFIAYNKQRKSTQRMKNDLCIKGVERTVIDEAFLENEFDRAEQEEKLIRSYCEKHIKSDMDEKQYNKILMSLIRKGFKCEQVKSVIRSITEEL